MDREAESFEVLCPWCGETIELYLEADVTGELVIDCEVCCRPWDVKVERLRGGGRSIHVEPAG